MAASLITQDEWDEWTRQRQARPSLRGTLEAERPDFSLPPPPRAAPPPQLVSAPVTDGSGAGVPSPSPTPSSVTATRTGPTGQSATVNQFGDQSLSFAEASAACGPAAAVAFYQQTGRNMTVGEATNIARDNGLWDAQNGMHGPAAQQKLLSVMGVPSKLEQGVDWDAVQRNVAGGNPVIVDSPGHYWQVAGYNPDDGRYLVGESGAAYRGGTAWMTPQEMTARSGEPRSVLYLDNPQTPQPGVAVTEPQGGDLQSYAAGAAQRAGLDPATFVRQIQQESGFNPNARNPSGATGIAQIVPRWHPGVDATDPYASLDYAASLMGSYVAKYGDYPTALAAYNAGPDAVRRYGGVPPFAETKTYIDKILGGQPAWATPDGQPPTHAPIEPGPGAPNLAALTQAAIDQTAALPPYEPPTRPYERYTPPQPQPMVVAPTVPDPALGPSSYDQPTAVTGPPPGFQSPAGPPPFTFSDRLNELNAPPLPPIMGPPAPAPMAYPGAPMAPSFTPPPFDASSRLAELNAAPPPALDLSGISPTAPGTPYPMAPPSPALDLSGITATPTPAPYAAPPSDVERRLAEQGALPPPPPAPLASELVTPRGTTTLPQMAGGVLQNVPSGVAGMVLHGDPYPEWLAQQQRNVEERFPAVGAANEALRMAPSVQEVARLAAPALQAIAPPFAALANVAGQIPQLNDVRPLSFTPADAILPQLDPLNYLGPGEAGEATRSLQGALEAERLGKGISGVQGRAAIGPALNGLGRGVESITGGVVGAFGGATASQAQAELEGRPLEGGELARNMALGTVVGLGLGAFPLPGGGGTYLFGGTGRRAPRVKDAGDALAGFEHLFTPEALAEARSKGFPDWLPGKLQAFQKATDAHAVAQEARDTLATRREDLQGRIAQLADTAEQHARAFEEARALTKSGDLSQAERAAAGQDATALKQAATTAAAELKAAQKELKATDTPFKKAEQLAAARAQAARWAGYSGVVTRGGVAPALEATKQARQTFASPAQSQAAIIGEVSRASAGDVRQFLRGLIPSIHEGGLAVGAPRLPAGPEREINDLLTNSALANRTEGLAQMTVEQMAEQTHAPKPLAEFQPLRWNDKKGDYEVGHSAYGMPRSLDELRLAVQLGLPWMNWYHQFGTAAREIVGEGNMREFAALFAATSARTKVHDNFSQALAIMRWARELTMDGKPVTLENLVAKQKLERIESAAPTLEGEVQKMPMTTEKLEKAAALYQSGSALVPSNLKTPSYGSNIYSMLHLDYDPHSVIDVWMSRLFGYKFDNELAGSTEIYRFVDGITRYLARERGIAPNQAQAAGWFAMKAMFEDPKTAGLVKALDRGEISLGDALLKAEKAGIFANPAPTGDLQATLEHPTVLEAIRKARWNPREGAQVHLPGPAEAGAPWSGLAHPGQNIPSRAVEGHRVGMPGTLSEYRSVAEGQAPSVQLPTGLDLTGLRVLEDGTIDGISIPHRVVSEPATASRGGGAQIVAPGTNRQGGQYLAATVLDRLPELESVPVHTPDVHAPDDAGLRVAGPPEQLAGLTDALADVVHVVQSSEGDFVRLVPPSEPDAELGARITAEIAQFPDLTHGSYGGWNDQLTRADVAGHLGAAGSPFGATGQSGLQGGGGSLLDAVRGVIDRARSGPVYADPANALRALPAGSTRPTYRTDAVKAARAANQGGPSPSAARQGGAFVPGLEGAALSQAETDDHTTPQERAARAAAGFGAGILGGRFMGGREAPRPEGPHTMPFPGDLGARATPGPVTVPQLVSWARYNGMLSGPAGRLKDIISSGLAQSGYPLERAAAVPFDLVQSKLLGTPRTIYGRQVRAEVTGMAGALSDGWRAAVQTMASGVAPSAVRPDLAAATQEPHAVSVAGRTIPIPNALRVAGSLPTRFVNANDAFFGTLASQAAAASIATREAIKEGFTGAELEQRAHELIDHPTIAMAKEAAETRQYRVWQEDGRLNKALGGLRDLPGGSLVIPFVQTPVNLAKYVAERSPLGLAMLVGEHAGAAMGATTKPTTAHTAEMLGRVAVGSTVGFGLYQLAQRGEVSGPPPDAPAERDAWARQGKQPYSVKIGDAWHDYRAWSLSPLLAAAAVTADKVKAGDVEGAGALATTTALATARALVDQSFVQGLSNFSAALDDPERHLQSFVNSTATSFVPSALQSLARATDPYVRQPEGNPLQRVGGALAAAVPGLGRLVPERVGAFGQPRARPGLQQGPLGILNPFRSSGATQDPVELELARLAAAGYKVEPTLVGGSIQLGQAPGATTDVQLEPSEREQYQTQAGQLAYGQLQLAMGDPSWSAQSDKDKERYIQTVLRGARNAAREQMQPGLTPRGIEQYQREQTQRQERGGAK